MVRKVRKGPQRSERSAKVSKRPNLGLGPIVYPPPRFCAQGVTKGSVVLGVGFFGFSYFLAAKDKLQAASIDGGQPSLASIQDYSYAVARPLFFYVKKAHVGVIPGLHEFVKEFTTKKAIGKGGYLADIGLVPLDSTLYKTTRTNATKLVAMGN